MKTSESLNELALALSKSQSEFPIVGKGREAQGRSFSFMYCKKEDLITPTRPILTKYGLSVTQIEENAMEGRKFLISTLMHSSGQYIRIENEIFADPKDPKSFGAAKTKLEKRLYVDLIGLVVTNIDEDEEEREEANKIPTKIELINDQELENLKRVCLKKPELEANIKNAYGITDLSMLPKDKYAKIFGNQNTKD